MNISSLPQVIVDWVGHNSFFWRQVLPLIMLVTLRIRVSLKGTKQKQNKGQGEGFTDNQQLYFTYFFASAVKNKDSISSRVLWYIKQHT